MKKLFSLFFITLFSVSMWANNEYNKKYLYVNATQNNWYTNDDALPCIDGFDDYACNTKKFFMENPTGTIATKIWYFDLSQSGYDYYSYTRGFKIQRHASDWYANEYKIGYVDGDTKNCLWIGGGDGAQTVAWGYYAVPITSIALAGSNNIISGEGTEINPYHVLVGNAITLTATPTFTPADETMMFCANFGVSPAENPTTEQNSSTYTVNSTDKVELKCVGRNKYGDVYSADVTSTSVWVQGVASYTLTYSIGTIAGTEGSISSSPETASGSTILSGNTVTLTAPAAKAGYTWSGWYTNAAGTEGKIEDTNRAISVTMDDDKTLYACYTENKSAITINAPESYKGTLSITGEQSLGVATTVSVIANAANGYKFHEWTSTGNAVLSSTYDKSITVSADGTDGGSGTVSAVFVSRFAVIGSDIDDNYGAVNGMPGWDDYSKTLDYVDANDFERTFTLKGNTTYKFRLRDFATDKNLGYKDEGTISLNGGECWLNDYYGDVKFTLDGSDEVTFKIIGFGGDHVNLQVNTSDGSTTSYTASYYSQTFFKNSTNETSTTGGTVSAIDGKGFDLATGGKVKAGGSVVFTAVPNANYTFAGWFSDVACTDAYVAGEDVAIDEVAKTLTLSHIAADKTVYAKFQENTTPTAIDNTDAATKAVKRIVNGQLVIEREGKLFNALGAEVK